jgi:ribosomal protein L37AE/L43A
MYGIFHDDVCYALRGFSKSKKDPAASGIWECHDCHEGAVIPGTYKNIHGETVKIDPKTLDPNTEVIRF